jgi:hypothetical protein
MKLTFIDAIKDGIFISAYGISLFFGIIGLFIWASSITFFISYLMFKEGFTELSQYVLIIFSAGTIFSLAVYCIRTSKYWNELDKRFDFVSKDISKKLKQNPFWKPLYKKNNNKGGK